MNKFLNAGSILDPIALIRSMLQKLEFYENLPKISKNNVLGEKNNLILDTLPVVGMLFRFFLLFRNVQPHTYPTARIKEFEFLYFHYALVRRGGLAKLAIEKCCTADARVV